MALIGEYPTQTKATRARSQYRKRNPGSPEPVFIRSRSQVSRKMLLNPSEDWPRE